MQRTLFLIKPDGLQRRLVGEIIARLERKGLSLIGIKMLRMDDQAIADHYKHLSTRPFFPEIAAFMKSAPIIATCWSGVEAVATVRVLCGATNGRTAMPGTIRGDLAMSVQANLVHASETPEAAEEELRAFFAPTELFDYSDKGLPLIYSTSERADNA
jgi:nucleoside-diphosphate kinase